MVAPSLQDRYDNAEIALDRLKSIDITGKSQVKLPAQSSQVKPNSIILIAIAATILFVITGLIISTVHHLFKAPNKTIVRHSNNKSRSSSVYTSEQKWFNEIKPNCNSVEVVTAMRRANYLKTPKGIGYAASCYALAGRIDLADKIIQELPPNLRVYAAGVLFNIGHPVADAGDDRSAGPIMELVLKYWSQNYMALYHAGMSAYVLGEYPQAENHLQEFLRVYRNQDGWRQTAKQALKRIEQNIPADDSFSIHH